MSNETLENNEATQDQQEVKPKIGDRDIKPETLEQVALVEQVDEAQEVVQEKVSRQESLDAVMEADESPEEGQGGESATEAELGGVDEMGMGPMQRDRANPDKEARDKTWWEDAEGENPVEKVVIQPPTSGEKTIPHKLDESARKETDYWSTWKENPQPDGGQGAEAMASAYHARVQKLEEEGKLPPEDKKLTVVDVSDSGKGLRDFMDVLRKTDEEQQTNVAERTRGVVICSEERAAQLKAAEEKSGTRDEAIEIQGVDLNEPEKIEVPEDTMAVMLDGTTNKMETYQMVRVRPWADEPRKEGNRGYRDAKTTTTLAGAEPQVVVDTETGQTEAINPNNWFRLSHHTAEGDPAEYTPQLLGRLVLSDGVTRKEGAAHEGTNLERKELDVRRFMDDKATGRPYNYSPASEALVQRFTGGVRKDGMVMVSGLLRESPDQKLVSAGLIHQQRVPIKDENGKTTGWVPLSPVRYHVTEGDQVVKGAAKADENAQVTTICDKPGDYGYVFIDRAGGEAAAKAQETIREGVAPKGKTVEEVFEQTRQTLSVMATSEEPEIRDMAAKMLEKRLQETITGNEQTPGNPHLERNYSLQLGLAEIYNEYGLTASARQHAAQAAELMPVSSAAQLELAKASMADDNFEEAQAALDRARQLSPRNAEIYKVGTELAKKQEDIESEVEYRLHYLRNAPAQKPEQIMEGLGELCEAMKRDSAQHQDTIDTFKTIVVHDLTTNQYHPIEIPVDMAKRIRAADTALSARNTVQQMLNYHPDITGQEADEIVERFTNIWEDTQIRGADAAKAAEVAVARLVARRQEMFERGEIERPLTTQEAAQLISQFTNLVEPIMANIERDADPYADNSPLPRDKWMDRPAKNCRWIYAGTLSQSDAECPPDALSKLQYPTPIDALVEGRQETTPENDGIPAQVEIAMGQVMDIDDTEKGPIGIEKDTMLRGVLVVGQTGSGKSVTLGTIADGVPKLGANLIMVDAGGKPGLDEAVDDLAAKGIDMMRIEPNNPDAVPISIDIFRPIEGCPPQQHIGTVVQTWLNAFGEMEGPVQPILELALEDVYAQNGWNIKTLEERNGEANMHTVLEDPPAPTMLQLQRALEKRCEGYVGDARNLIPYFKTRTNRLMTDTINPILQPEGSNALDWNKFMDANVYVDLHRIQDPDLRRFFGRAMLAKYNVALQQRGLQGNELRTVLMIDEAHTFLECKPTDPAAKQKAVEETAMDMRNNRGYGVASVMATQSPALMHPVALGQAATVIAQRLETKSETEAMRGKNFGDAASEALPSLTPGIAYIRKLDTPEPLKVSITAATPPTPAQREAAAHREIPLPIVQDSTTTTYTQAERHQASMDSRAKGQDRLRIMVDAITKSHITGYSLPSKVPPKLKEKWDQLSAADRKKAELLVLTVVEEDIAQRRSALPYNPKYLGASVLATTIGMLDGTEPMAAGRHASPDFKIPQIAWAENYTRITTPHNQKTPPDHNVAPPLQGVPDVTPEAGQRVVEQREMLQRHELSPGRDKRNGEVAWEAILGVHDGQPLWRDLETATGGEPSMLRRRRIIAEELGYLPDVEYPGFSDYERMLALPVAIKDQTENPDLVTGK